METEKTEVALSIEADCKKIEEQFRYIAEIASDRESIQRHFDIASRELDEVEKEENQKLDKLLKHLRRNNDVTLRHHSVSNEIRALAYKMLYVPKHKSLPLEERLDAMEQSVAKLADDVRHMRECVGELVAL